MTRRTSRTHAFRHLVPVMLALAGGAAGCASAGAGATTQAAPAGTTSKADLRAVDAAEQTWARALIEGDVARLATIVTPEFSFTGPDGQVEDAAAYLQGYRDLPKMGMRVVSIDMDDVKTQLFGDTAIVTGRALARVQVQGNAIVENVRFTRVYERRNGRWQMRAGQGTRIVPEDGSGAHASAEPLQQPARP